MSTVPNPANASPADGFADEETAELLARLAERLKAIPVVYELGVAEGARRAQLDWADLEKLAYADGYVDGLSKRYNPPKS